MLNYPVAVLGNESLVYKELSQDQFDSEENLDMKQFLGMFWCFKEPCFSMKY